MSDVPNVERLRLASVAIRDASEELAGLYGGLWHELEGLRGQVGLYAEARRVDAIDRGHLIAAVTWWRDYATNLSQGRDVYPESPYPPLTPSVPYPPQGVKPGAAPTPEPPAVETWVKIDGLKHVVQVREMTGRELRNLPLPPISDDYDLFRIFPGANDVRVRDEDVMRLPGQFFTAPKIINAGQPK